MIHLEGSSINGQKKGGERSRQKSRSLQEEGFGIMFLQECPIGK